MEGGGEGGPREHGAVVGGRRAAYVGGHGLEAISAGAAHPHDAGYPCDWGQPHLGSVVGGPRAGEIAGDSVPTRGAVGLAVENGGREYWEAHHLVEGAPLLVHQPPVEPPEEYSWAALSYQDQLVVPVLARSAVVGVHGNWDGQGGIQASVVGGPNFPVAYRVEGGARIEMGAANYSHLGKLSPRLGEGQCPHVPRPHSPSSGQSVPVSGAAPCVRARGNLLPPWGGSGGFAPGGPHDGPDASPGAPFLPYRAAASPSVHPETVYENFLPLHPPSPAPAAAAVSSARVGP